MNERIERSGRVLNKEGLEGFLFFFDTKG